MVIIKRYQNRKLYDTEEKRYVTLEGIAGLIRAGKEIQVVDNASGEDITTLTLTQIILEQERGAYGYLSDSFLTGLIRAGGDWLVTFQHGLRSPQNFLRQIDEEIRCRIQALVHAGELSEGEGHGMLEKLLSQTARFNERHRLDEKIQSYLETRQIPSQGDIQALRNQVQRLEEKLAKTEDANLQSEELYR